MMINLLVQIYVDDTIFISTNDSRCQEFLKCMHREFEISMMGPLKYFPRLQIQQKGDGIFINQSKYIQEPLKKYDMVNIKQSSTSMANL